MTDKKTTTYAVTFEATPGPEHIHRWLSDGQCYPPEGACDSNIWSEYGFLLNDLRNVATELAAAQAHIAELEKALYEITECTSIEGALEVAESFGLLDPNSDALKRYERLRLSRKELERQGREFLRSYKPEAVEGLSVNESNDDHAPIARIDAETDD